MKALTIWQPWASLIANGWKPYEYRKWPAHRAIVGQRIVIHSAARPFNVRQVPSVAIEWVAGRGDGRCVAQGFAFIDDVLRIGAPLIYGVGLCTVLLGEPRKAIDLFVGKSGHGDIDPDVWAWPVSDVQPFKAPIPARGMQGFWDWTGPTE